VTSHPERYWRIDSCDLAILIVYGSWTDDRSVFFLVVGRILGVFHRLVLLMFVSAK
jgi:hypothetical protein